MSARWLIAGTGAALILGFLSLGLSDDLRHDIPRFLTLYAVTFVIYVVAVVAVARGNVPSSSWKLILAVAILARLTLLPAAPQLSTDIYRYLWEGRVVASGENPFALSPDSPELEPLRDGNYDGIGHKHMETIYPPVAQGAFALGAMIRPTLTTQKVLITLFDIATILLIMLLLRQRRENPAWSIVYAWSPLVIFETAHSGHADAIGVFFLVLGLLYLGRERRAMSAVAMALSFLSKYVAVVLVPWALLRRRHAVWLPLAMLIVIVAFLPFAGAGAGLVRSLHTYSSEWVFNGAAYGAMFALVRDAEWARRILGAFVIAWAIVQARYQEDVVRYGFRAIAAALLATPTLYPWYLMWIVPFLCFFRNRAWILFTGLIGASYFVWVVSDRTGEWGLPWAVYLIEYVPFYALLLYDARRAQQKATGA